MRNQDRYKTAKERAEAFLAFCNDSYDENDACKNCKLNGTWHEQCTFVWLDLEAEEEKPLPCPFCGGEMDVSASKCAIHCVCGYSSPIDRNISKVIAAHNRVAKAVREVKE